MSDTEITKRAEQASSEMLSTTELNDALSRSVNTVYKQYLYDLENNPVIIPSDAFLDQNEDNIRMIKLRELSCKKGEDIFQKLSTVYNASMSVGCSLYVMVDVKYNNAPADIYIGLRYKGIQSDGVMNDKLNSSFSALKKGLTSNFPGTRFENVSDKKALIDDVFGSHTNYISSVSCVASTRDKSKTENKSFIQGIERFIDTMQGNTYTAIFLAEPLDHDEQAAIRSGYESLYSTLSSFRKISWSYSETDSEAVMESLTKGISDTITEGVANTQSHGYSLGANVGINAGRTNGMTNGTSRSEGTTNALNKPDVVSLVGKAVGGLFGAAAAVLTMVNPAAGVVTGGVASCVGGLTQGRTSSKGTTNSIGSSIANSIGSYFGGNMGLNGGIQRSSAETHSDSSSHSEQESKTTGTTSEHSTGKSLQIENINKHIDEMLNRIDEQIKRCREGEDYGSYSCSAYILSSKQENCMLAANTYRALMLGDGSSVESGAINLWNGNNVAHKEIVPVMKQYLSRFVHPVFAMPISRDEGDVSIIPYTPGNIVSGLELPLHLGLPTRSVYGLPVIEHAEFGRNIASQSEESKNSFELGKIYHMGQVESSKVDIDIDSLASHTFITGSTGAGKSNTIYHMLDKLSGKGVKFIVVEPAKGEYGSVLSQRDDVTVYGTNPRTNTELLRIDPFSFPDDVHVLEHMDRLIEIFNVCWPMYAAMPAILKDAVERAYTVAGWDLEMSVNKYGERIFPTFADVLEQIRLVLDESDYSSDNKGDYIGSLVTRIHSLTNGINGLIFTSDEIGDERLFDNNSIVDLSRVGSSETKALIMGLLVLKLQEYRMSQHEVNSSLNHVTVLEEAHNLLKRTSYEQTIESANLLGKSVEMLANSIAEMRTYGEGFIIADQAPGLLDMSVIRNTNTKIIMRLPDISDRELVGKAAGLNDDQITELAKLDKGVAAVYQSNWLEPVLCNVPKYVSSNTCSEQPLQSSMNIKQKSECSSERFTKWILEHGIYNKIDSTEFDSMKEYVLKSRLSAAVKCGFIEYHTVSPDRSQDVFRSLIFDYFNAEKAFRAVPDMEDVTEWIKAFVQKLDPHVPETKGEQSGILAGLLLREKAGRDSQYLGKLYEYTKVLKLKEGVL